MPCNLSEELSCEIKRVEVQIEEVRRHIRNEAKSEPQLGDTAKSVRELRALQVRLQELKHNQATLMGK